MKISILLDVPDDEMHKNVFQDPYNVELDFHNYRTGWVVRKRAGEYVLAVGDSVAEVVALRVVQLLKEWNGEKPLDTHDLKIGSQDGQ